MWLLLVLTITAHGNAVLDKHARYASERQCQQALRQDGHRLFKRKARGACVRASDLDWALSSIYGGDIKSLWP
jgi:hypothetical protein